MRTDGKMTLAVTGGIGSGKSLVCSMLGRKGIPVYDSDSRTKALYDTVPGLSDRISMSLGMDVRDGGGRIDRKKLASAVFSSPKMLEALEGIVYPEVRKDFEDWRKECFEAGADIVIMESALILEKPFFLDLFDRILVVDAPVEIRLGRAVRRDGTDRDSVLARMAGQRLLNEISEGRAVPVADYIILNDGDIAGLEKKVTEFYHKIIEYNENGSF